jgi:spore coat protein CotH
MVANKHITKIIIAVMAVVVVFCLLAVAFSDRFSDMLGGTEVGMEYKSELFDTDEIISIDILMDEDEWNTMLSNAMSEEYYACDVVVNGTTFKNVGIRPKGNTSLSSIAMDPDTDRFSLKLEFDQFVDGQTCFGLDKLILNNNYADATNMKEAIIYDMFQYIGADASLYNYAKISLNGDYRGVYLALEGVEDSFMLRNFGTQAGELYKPESMGMGGGNASSGKNAKGQGGPPVGGGDFGKPPEGFDPANMPDMGDFKPGDMPDMPEKSDSVSGDNAGERRGPGDFQMSSRGGANLNYTDDDLDSYSTIWEGSITDTGTADHRRVVTALEKISKGEDLEEYLDVDNILKYMAVHTFAVNNDSLSGTMAHNYYLYEYNGQLNIFPWDYNLSFGGMFGGREQGGTSVVNDAIDTPFDSTEFFDALLENEEYLEKYHEYLQMLADEYVDGGRFDEVYSRIRDQIDELVKTDPTAFYNYDEYQEAVQILYDVVKLRAESIRGQIEGSIPSTDEGQREDDSALTDASDIDISVMGTMNMGGGDDGDNAVKRGRRNRQGVSGNNMPFGPGMPGQTDYTTVKKNAVILGICLAGMAAVLLIFVRIKRRI